MQERKQLQWDAAANTASGPWRRARKAVEGKGFSYRARLALRWAILPLWQLFGKVFRRGFTFQATHYPYFVHNYNFTWCNERAVEIPIVLAELRAHRGSRVLEVGNVLSHYFDVEHEVLDKYERANGVRNEDVVSFRAERPYDLIISISTLEHVGWDDEERRDPGKIERAFDNLRAQLAPGGRLVATVPVGYNPHLDALLAAARPFSRCYYLKRQGMTVWQEADWPAVAGAAYDERWPGARGLVIGVVER